MAEQRSDHIWVATVNWYTLVLWEAGALNRQNGKMRMKTELMVAWGS